MISIEDVVFRATSTTFDCQFVTNVFRSVLVEAMVAAALPQWDWCSADYAPYDLRHPDGTRIEVKQSAARQTWHRGRASRAVWDIKPRKGYYKDDGVTWVDCPGRNADIYVLAHHPLVDDTADHRDATQWRFYVIPARALPATKTISKTTAVRLAEPTGIFCLPERVAAAHRHLLHDTTTVPGDA